MKKLLLFISTLAFLVSLTVRCDENEEPTLTVSGPSLTVGATENSTGTFTITSTTSWTVSSSESWLTVNPASGSNDATVVVTAQPNTGASDRTATVTVTAAGVAEQTVTVTQEGTTLILSTTSLSISLEENSTATFDIISDTTWTISVPNTYKWLIVSPASGSKNATITVTAQQNTGVAARAGTINVVAKGAAAQSVTVTQDGDSGIEGCSIPALPSYAALPVNAKLPDPFTFMNGTRMTSKDEWPCRRAEIAVLAQEFEFGYKPNTPYDGTTGSFSSNTITVNVSDNGTSISFACTITYPSSGSAPYPAMIGIGGSNLNNTLLSNLGVAVVTFPNNEIAQQLNSGSRGTGKFYDMFGYDHSAGALMAWAWGVSRLIDALEKTPAANIDPTRLGVTGCSRNGKGALTVGAYDERIVLTVPQESGSGGAASWRVSDHMLANGQNTQTLSQITGENCWFRANFSQFGSSANKLPFDHHSVIGLVAPRAVLIIENDILWLGPESSWNCANAARKIWQALNVYDNMGFSMTTGHTHCAYPSSQDAELTAYVQKFLVGGGTGNTNVMRNDLGQVFDQSRWVDWTVPVLE